MYYVYMIQSIERNYNYVGVTCDLAERIEEHNSLRVESTRPYSPLKLIYYEAYSDKRDAFERERKLKRHGRAMYHLKKRLKYSLNQMLRD